MKRFKEEDILDIRKENGEDIIRFDYAKINEIIYNENENE